jgi:hypothetical protein
MQTEGVRDTVFQWTGSLQHGCPWHAFHDPFVARVLDVYPWFESGQVATKAPQASHRLIQGLAHYHGALSMCRSKRMDLEAEQRKKASAGRG